MASLSPERLQPYVTAAENDDRLALRLYLWNSAVADALHTALHISEVTVRNAMHRELIRVYGPDWHVSGALPLKPKSAQLVQDAIDKIQDAGKPVTAGRVVSELTLGFWVHLCDKNLETKLWITCLKSAFPHAPPGFTRSQARGALDSIRRIRNRVAHHERIITDNPEIVYEQSVTAVGWVCPTTRTWLRRHSRFQDVFSKRPFKPSGFAALLDKFELW